MHIMTLGDSGPRPNGQLLQAHNLGSPSNSKDVAPLINSLPLELLVKILGGVYQLIRRRSRGLPSDETWTVRYQLVCRRWREIIRSTPQFWQEIGVWASPRWLAFSLKRCAGAPATVSAYHPVRPDEIYVTLRQHASSLGACYIHSSLLWLPSFASLLATPMPALETLSLDGDGQLADVAVTHDLVPRLTTLDLRGCTAPLDTTIYTSLRSLTLFGSSWTISYGDFLHLMGKCHNLEYLSLDAYIINRFTAQIDQPRTMSAVLRCLRVLKLSGYPKTLFHLLTTLHAPRATRIELRNYLKDMTSDPLVTRLLAPNPQLRYPFLSSPRTVSLRCWDDAPFKLSLLCGPDRDALFSIGYGTLRKSFKPGNANLQPNLIATTDTFSALSVDTLEVEGCLDLVAVETWQRVFETFSNLRTLKLRGVGTLDVVWAGLSRATACSLERDGVLCCARLSEIATDSDHIPPFKFIATPTLLEGVREALGARAEAGAARLKKLKLYLEYTRELWMETYRHGNAALEDVRALVDELDYRDCRAS